jgi:hypothetical protein
MSPLRTVVAVFALLALVAIFFAALVAADDPPTRCAPVPGRAHRAGGIVSHDIGPGKLSCAQVRRLLRRWIRARFPPRLDGWRFSYRQDCSCHFATRVLDGQPRRFSFT